MNFSNDILRLCGQVWNADGTFRHSTDLVRVVDGKRITYRQTYIISTKIECNDGVFCFPIVYALMRKKSKLSYYKLLEHLDAIHAEYNPESPPLIPRALSVDMEKACIVAFKQYFDEKHGIDLKIRLCSFHLKQAVKRYLENQWKNVPKSRALMCRIFKLCCAMVYSPFQVNPLLRARFCQLLTDEVADANSKARAAVSNLIQFLQTNYLVMHEDQSFKCVSNWNYFGDILSGETDTTNNTSETINRKFNQDIKLGFKNFKKVAISIYQNKKYYIDKLHETVKKNRFRKRPLALRRKMARREDICFDFHQKEPEEQLSLYKTFLLEISKEL